MREAKNAKDVVLVGIDNAEEHHCLWNHLAQHGHHDVVVGHRKPLLVGAELQLGSNGIGRDEEDEQHDDAGHNHRTQIDVIVGPGICNLMQIDTDGLQESLNLRIGIAFGTHGALPYGG